MRSNEFWTTERDERLREGAAQGLSFADIGTELGCSRNAAVARFHRLRGTRFPSDVLREHLRARDARERSERVQMAQSTYVDKMLADIHQGNNRIEAMLSARNAGATLRNIGQAIGLSPARVRQLTMTEVEDRN